MGFWSGFGGSLVGILLSALVFALGAIGCWIFLLVDNILVLVGEMFILSLFGSIPILIFWNGTAFIIVFLLLLIFTVLVALGKIPPNKVKIVSIAKKIPFVGAKKLIPLLEKAVPEINSLELNTQPIWLLIFPFLIIGFMFLGFIFATGWWAILSIFISIALIIVLIVLSIFAGGFPWVEIAEAAPKYMEKEMQKIEKKTEQIATNAAGGAGGVNPQAMAAVSNTNTAGGAGEAGGAPPAKLEMPKGEEKEAPKLPQLGPEVRGAGVAAGSANPDETAGEVKETAEQAEEKKARVEAAKARADAESKEAAAKQERLGEIETKLAEKDLDPKKRKELEKGQKTLKASVEKGESAAERAEKEIEGGGEEPSLWDEHRDFVIAAVAIMFLSLALTGLVYQQVSFFGSLPEIVSYIGGFICLGCVYALFAMKASLSEKYKDKPWWPWVLYAIPLALLLVAVTPGLPPWITGLIVGLVLLAGMVHILMMWWKKHKGQKGSKKFLVFFTIILLLVLMIAPKFLCSALGGSAFSFCAVDEYFSGPLRQGVGTVIDGIVTTVKNWVYGAIKNALPNNPLIKDLKLQSCYPFCIDPTGKDTKWQGLEVTRMEFIPHTIYSHQQFSVAMEFQNKGKTPATFQVPSPASQGADKNGPLYAILIDLLPDGWVSWMFGEDTGFHGGMFIKCTESCKIAPGIGGWFADLVTPSTDSGAEVSMSKCQEICPIDSVVDARPYVVGGCVGKITYRDSDQDGCVDDYDAHPDDSAGDLALLIKGDISWCADPDGKKTILRNPSNGKFYYEVGSRRERKYVRNGDLKLDANGLPLDCTLEPGDVLQMTWYGMRVSDAMTLDLGEENTPDASVQIQFQYAPANDLIGTISMMSAETQVAGAETKSIGRIANKITASYSPTGPLMMALGTAEEQVVSGSPFFFMVQFTNKGKGTIPQLSAKQQMLYMPSGFNARKSGCDFKEMKELKCTKFNEATGAYEPTFPWWDSKCTDWYPGPNFVKCKSTNPTVLAGLDPNSPAFLEPTDAGCNAGYEFEYTLYQPKEKIRELGKNIDPLYNPMYSCVFETPFEKNLKSYEIKYRVLRYYYQVEEKSDLKIIGTQIKPQFEDATFDCTPTDPCGTGQVCVNGFCYKGSSAAPTDSPSRVVLLDRHQEGAGDTDGVELYDENLNWIGLKNVATREDLEDIAVGDFFPDKPGQEVAILDDDIDSGKTDDIIFYSKKGDYITELSDVANNINYVAAGDLDPTKRGDELAVLDFSSKTLSYLIILTPSGSKLLELPLIGSETVKQSDIAVGRFDATSDRDEIAVLEIDESGYHIELVKLSEDGNPWLGVPEITRPTEDYGDMLDDPIYNPHSAITAGDFDKNTATDEIALLARNWRKDWNNEKWMGSDTLHIFSVGQTLTQITSSVLVSNDGSGYANGVGDIAAGDISGSTRGDEIVVLLWQWFGKTYDDDGDQIAILKQRDDGVYIYDKDPSVISNNEYGTFKNALNKDTQRIGVFDKLPQDLRKEYEKAQTGKTYTNLRCCAGSIKNPDKPEEVTWYHEWFSGDCPTEAPWVKDASVCNGDESDPAKAGTVVSKMQCTGTEYNSLRPDFLMTDYSYLIDQSKNQYLQYCRWVTTETVKGADDVIYIYKNSETEMGWDAEFLSWIRQAEYGVSYDPDWRNAVGD